MRGRGSTSSTHPEVVAPAGIDLSRAGSVDAAAEVTYDWRGGKIESGCIALDPRTHSEVLVKQLTFTSDYRGALSAQATVQQLRRHGLDSAVLARPTTVHASSLILLHPPAEAAALISALGLPADGTRISRQARFEDGIAYDWRGLPLLPGVEIAYPGSSRRREILSAVVKEVVPLSPTTPRSPFKLKVTTISGRSPRWLPVPGYVTVVDELPSSVTRPKDYPTWQWLNRSHRNLDTRGLRLAAGDRFITYQGATPEEYEVVSIAPDSFAIQAIHLHGVGYEFPHRPTAEFSPYKASEGGLFRVPPSPLEETEEEGTASTLLSLLAEQGIDGLEGKS